MLQFSNLVALHVQQIFNTYYTIDNHHCYEVAKQWKSITSKLGATCV